MDQTERLDRENWSRLLYRFHYLKNGKGELKNITMFYDEMFPDGEDFARWLVKGTGSANLKVHKTRVQQCQITYVGNRWTDAGSKIKITLPYNLDDLIQPVWYEDENMARGDSDEDESTAREDSDSDSDEDYSDSDQEDYSDDEMVETNGEKLKRMVFIY